MALRLRSGVRRRDRLELRARDRLELRARGCLDREEERLRLCSGGLLAPPVVWVVEEDAGAIVALDGALPQGRQSQENLTTAKRVVPRECQTMRAKNIEVHT